MEVFIYLAICLGLLRSEYHVFKLYWQPPWVIIFLKRNVKIFIYSHDSWSSQFKESYSRFKIKLWKQVLGLNLKVVSQLSYIVEKQ